MNITVEQELSFPDTSFLTSVLSVAQVTSCLHYISDHHRSRTVSSNSSSNSSNSSSNSSNSSNSNSSNTSCSRLKWPAHRSNCYDAIVQHCCMCAIWVSWLQGSGSSDFVDALTVAVDKLRRAVNDRPDLGKANVSKRVVLVSNFLDAAKEDPDDQFGSVLVDRMQEHGIRMEVQLLERSCSL